MIKVMFAGGKTGGHIFPAIAMALEFRKRYTRGKLVFVGTKGGMEEKIVPHYGFRLSLIRTKGLSRRSYMSNLLLAFHLLKGFYQARRILNQEKPGLVVGTGGYVSFPAVMLACLKNIPTMIQEQNSYPGISTRILARFADKVCLSYSESLRYFPVGKKFSVIGNPIRENLIRKEKSAALAEFGLEVDRKTIFVFGGSQGSHALNQTFLQCLDLLEPTWQILWQTGDRDFPEIAGKVKEKRVAAAAHPFIQDIGAAYAASDLVVSRAGALTLAEITACGKPSILIPFPFATADHQRHNAEALQRKGAAKMILEKNLTAERLAGEIGSLLSEESKLKLMAKRSAEMGKPEAAAMLVDEMEKLLSPGDSNIGQQSVAETRAEA
ncbi:MAG: undecaprenyldiphospho-muramoylpentapeptide beta-N-acetylglucosaminyltransferase [Candidatus Zixiibacteriota bacterium]|nr:MAG: undecaprenyldiphospho-muramoylpentapeptide beta-N-acetylglucosaminyltransferase [candidate division Zixibacteria bacterium]